jgi:hypothetical protein
MALEGASSLDASPQLGFDRNFFFRPLNPFTRFTWVNAYVG